jgi:hypothetical protein
LGQSHPSRRLTGTTVVPVVVTPVRSIRFAAVATTALIASGTAEAAIATSAPAAGRTVAPSAARARFIVVVLVVVLVAALVAAAAAVPATIVGRAAGRWIGILSRFITAVAASTWVAAAITRTVKVPPASTEAHDAWLLGGWVLN